MSLRVLLAEDDPDIQLVARLSLRKAGFSVTAVDNGAAVLARVVQDSPDVVLLDRMMPEMDGFEACRRLKADMGVSVTVAGTISGVGEARREGSTTNKVRAGLEDVSLGVKTVAGWQAVRRIIDSINGNTSSKDFIDAILTCLAPVTHLPNPGQGIKSHGQPGTGWKRVWLG